MKNVSPSRIARQALLGSALLFVTVTTANANEAFPNTSIPAVPNIDAEAYILIDYNSGKVLAENNADQRR
ncbi:MAG: serine-type D-Ala-D-Ala carboxypeptidase, partial [Providencia sp.]